MRILVFGRNGQVALELARLAERDGLTASFIGHDSIDLAAPDGPEAAARAIARANADAVINAAAYTAVDQAEAEEALAHRLNADAPAAMAGAAARACMPFVHLSTDYVFDGSGTAPRAPGDSPAPLSAYGRSKLAGEREVRAAGGAFAILRTSWIFSAHGRNFVKTVLRLSEARRELAMVADQIGGPTPAADIAAACVAIARGLAADRSRSGIYHFAGAPDVSWAEFARAILAAAGRDVAVSDIRTADYPTPARRPANSRLDCTGLSATFGIGRPDWRDGLARVVSELLTEARP